MNSMPTMSSLSDALHALQSLAADHPDLPAPHIDISGIFPNQLELSFHPDRTGSGLAGFESWCTALGIAPESVTNGAGTTTAWRTAYLPFAGAQLKLVGFFDLAVQEVAT